MNTLTSRVAASEGGEDGEGGEWDNAESQRDSAQSIRQQHGTGALEEEHGGGSGGVLAGEDTVSQLDGAAEPLPHRMRSRKSMSQMPDSPVGGGHGGADDGTYGGVDGRGGADGASSARAKVQEEAEAQRRSITSSAETWAEAAVLPAEATRVVVRVSRARQLLGASGRRRVKGGAGGSGGMGGGGGGGNDDSHINEMREPYAEVRLVAPKVAQNRKPGDTSSSPITSAGGRGERGLDRYDTKPGLSTSSKAASSRAAIGALRRTAVASRTLDPSWTDEFHWPLAQVARRRPLSSVLLELSVHDNDR